MAITAGERAVKRSKFGGPFPKTLELVNCLFSGGFTTLSSLKCEFLRTIRAVGKQKIFLNVILLVLIELFSLGVTAEALRANIGS